MLLVTFFTLWLAVEGRAITLSAEYWDPARCEADIPALTRVVEALLEADPTVTLLTGPDSTDACVPRGQPEVYTPTGALPFPIHPHAPSPRSCPTLPRR